MYRRLFLSVAPILFVVAALSPRATTAQDAERLSSRHVPDDAVAVVFLSPSEILSSPDWELMPVEVIRAAGIEQLGVDPIDVDTVKMVFAAPGPEGPRMGAVVRFVTDFKISDVRPALLSELDQREIEGLAVYEGRGLETVRFHQLDARTVIVSMGGYLKPLLEATDEGAGELPTLLRKLSPRDGVTFVAAIEQIRPTLNMIAGLAGPNLPPQLSGAVNAVEWIDALMFNVDFAPASSSITLSALAPDEESVIRLEQLMNQAVEVGREVFVAEARANYRDDGSAASEAMHRYFARIGGHLADQMRPQRNGNVLRIHVEGFAANATMILGLLAPTIKASREVRQRLALNNHLKLIGLALHNYHSAYNKLPDHALRDSDGNALLSWRVAILPFLDQGDLYKQFRLDEPWDGPHNIKLLEKMPKAYVNPTAAVEPGHTVYQMPLGPGLMFDETAVTKFRDVTDGLSETIMLLECRSDLAVPWTKPADHAIDLNDPHAGVGEPGQQGFYVLMGDGAPIRLTRAVTQEDFKTLLTRAAGDRFSIPD